MPVATQFLTAAGPALGCDVILGREPLPVSIKLCRVQPTEPSLTISKTLRVPRTSGHAQFAIRSLVISPAQTFPKVISFWGTILDVMGAGFGC